MTPNRPLLELRAWFDPENPEKFAIKPEPMMEVLRAADAVMAILAERPNGSGCKICRCIYPPHTIDGCALQDYERAVEAWEKANG